MSRIRTRCADWSPVSAHVVPDRWNSLLQAAGASNTALNPVLYALDDLARASWLQVIS